MKADIATTENSLKEVLPRDPRMGVEGELAATTAMTAMLRVPLDHSRSQAEQEKYERKPFTKPALTDEEKAMFEEGRRRSPLVPVSPPRPAFG